MGFAWAGGVGLMGGAAAAAAAGCAEAVEGAI